jgi:ABC-2 type transport system ATP-binding protein
MRQDYRRITMGFAAQPHAYDFQIHGIQQVPTVGRQVIVLTSGNADVIVEYAHSLEAVSVDVTPIGLREGFLETVKEEA